jgi:hypothetical protein
VGLKENCSINNLQLISYGTQGLPDKDYALTQTRTPDHDDTDHLKIEVAPQNDS